MDLVIFLPLLIVMGAFMFFASRRQKKAMQATIDLHNSLQVGDLIHTTSGLRATITDIGDEYVDLEIAPGVITTWMKLAVRDRITDDVEDDDADDIEDSADDLENEIDNDTVVSRSEPISGPKFKGTEITESPNAKTDS
ncbi:MAG: preprotein translocase subunit YajC [Mycolicibacterium sp.]|uniref:preprotein translocase subunit YajC n=1 Tax=Mycolicibacterium sp. TaxID=2320850 RepID=UPI003D0D5B9F